MRGCWQDQILFLKDPALPAVSFYSCRRSFRTSKNSLKAWHVLRARIHILLISRFQGKSVSVPLSFGALSDSEDSGSYCMQVYPSALRVRRKGKTISGASGWDRPLLPCQYRLSASGAGAWQGFRPCEPSRTVRADDRACRQIVNHNEQ